MLGVVAQLWVYSEHAFKFRGKQVTLCVGHEVHMHVY